MKVYYYHTRPILPALEEWKAHKHPGHLLYGLTHFPENGIGTVIHPFKSIASRWRLMLYNLRQILLCKEDYDILYGTSYRGLELLVFLRAVGLYRKPIAIWHHQAVPKSKGWLNDRLSRLFYKGIDCMFFFSQALIDDSLTSGKVQKDCLFLIHWGADLAFYDRLSRQPKDKEFVSTGKENRDFPTLFQAFAETDMEISVFIPPSNGDKEYTSVVRQYERCPNIHMNLVQGIIPYRLAVEVAHAEAVAISCLNYPYTVGLTTLVEALALGIPVIATRNPKFEMDLEKEGAGILVGHGDTEGWKQAASYLHNHPDKAREMGEKGRELAEKTYNLENYTHELADVLKALHRQNALRPGQ